MNPALIFTLFWAAILLVVFEGTFHPARWTWGKVHKWLTMRRRCSWCAPKRFVGGNPFARSITDTICPRCLAQIKWDMAHPHVVRIHNVRLVPGLFNSRTMQCRA